MNTTPSTHSGVPAYTVVGTYEPGSLGRCGLIVLNRGSRILREKYLERVTASGFDEVILIETQENSYSVENLIRRFPELRFLLIGDSNSAGERINLALNEMVSEYVLVIWSDIEPSRLSPAVLNRMRSDSATVFVPVLRNESGEVIPTITAPVAHKRSLRIVTMAPQRDGLETLFPADYVGIYHRNRFLDLGGYDRRIAGPFWQKMDFGFRLHLWGEKIVLVTGLRLRYRSATEPEDQTPDVDYPYFFARNLSVRISSDGAGIPVAQAFHLIIRSGAGIFEGISVFRKARRWVRENRDRFLHEARGLIRDWSAGTE